MYSTRRSASNRVKDQHGAAADLGIGVPPDRGSLRGEGGVVRCPICGSAQTGLYRTDVVDLEYFVIPPRDFAMQKCRDCGSQFLTPRPLESELPPFYPADYHAYNENHSGVARLLVQFRARSGPASTANSSRVAPAASSMSAPATAAISTSSVDSSTWNARESKFSRRSRPRVEREDTTSLQARSRASDLTGHIGRYDIVSMNHVLEHVVSPERCSSVPTIYCGQGDMSSASCRRSRPGRAGFLGATGVAITSRGTCRSHRSRDSPAFWSTLACRLSGSGRRRIFRRRSRCRTPCSTRVASCDAERQNTRLRCPPRRRPPFRNGRLAVRPGWHRQLSSAERALVTALSG